MLCVAASQKPRGLLLISYLVNKLNLPIINLDLIGCRVRWDIFHLMPGIALQSSRREVSLLFSAEDADVKPKKKKNTCAEEWKKKK